MKSRWTMPGIWIGLITVCAIYSIFDPPTTPDRVAATVLVVVVLGMKAGMSLTHDAVKVLGAMVVLGKPATFTEIGPVAGIGSRTLKVLWDLEKAQVVDGEWATTEKGDRVRMYVIKQEKS